MVLQALKLALAPLAWPLLSGTWRMTDFDPEHVDGCGPVIFACLHRDILPAICYVRPARPVLLVSNSPDGDILVKTLGRRGYEFVRGGTGDDGGRAFVKLRRLVAQGRFVGLAVDGPEGPFGAIHEGVLLLAKLSGAPIVPLVARTASAVVLRTWDRTVVPRPFSSVEMIRGRALDLPADLDEAGMAKARQDLAHSFGLTKEQA